MTKTKLAKALDLHAKWLRNEEDGKKFEYHADLSHADLSRANLSHANLSYANLSYANLSNASLSYANLSNANLFKADLSNANLFKANPSYANLSNANLSNANLFMGDLSHANLFNANLFMGDLSHANLFKADLSHANLSYTCLVPQSRWKWVRAEKCPMRSLQYRTLVLGSRTQHQPHMDGDAYETGKLYTAPYFSACPTAACHPGLYIAGGPKCSLRNDAKRLLVAFWLDEMMVVRKCRVPRFRTVESVAAFKQLKASDMEEVT